MSDIYDQLKYIARCKHTPDMFGGDKVKEDRSIERIKRVSDDMGGYCHDETIEEFIKEADKYHDE